MAMLVGFIIAAGIRQDMPLSDQHRNLKAIRSLQQITCNSERGCWLLQIKACDEKTRKRLMQRIDKALSSPVDSSR